MKQLLKMLAAVFSKRRAKRDMKVLRMQVYLMNIFKSDTFLQLTLPDKVSSIARIIDIFQRDFGFTPQELQKMVSSLKKRLDSNVAKVWDTTYSQYFSKGTRKN